MNRPQRLEITHGDPRGDDIIAATAARLARQLIGGHVDLFDFGGERRCWRGEAHQRHAVWALRLDGSGAGDDVVGLTAGQVDQYLLGPAGVRVTTIRHTSKGHTLDVDLWAEVREL